jgi:carbon-monoxide dehydrogenase medium subunit
MLTEFELLRPGTLSEALEMLAEGAPGVTPLAGGTNVIVDLRDRRRQYSTLMDVSGLDELRGIRQEDGQVVIGGGTTIAELLDNPLIAEQGAPLRQAAAVLGSPLVRNRATVGGNLVDASPAADTAPPLLVLDAEVELASHAGTRRMPLEKFITGPNETLLEPNELLVAIRWPVPAEGSTGGFHKLGLRKALACSVLTAAALVQRNGNGLCQHARIALGAVAPTPIRAYAAEGLLEGQALTPERVADAARLSAEAAQPIDDVRGTAVYRQRTVAVLVRRLLSDATGNAQTPPRSR